MRSERATARYSGMSTVKAITCTLRLAFSDYARRLYWLSRLASLTSLLAATSTLFATAPENQGVPANYTPLSGVVRIHVRDDFFGDWFRYWQEADRERFLALRPDGEPCCR